MWKKIFLPWYVNKCMWCRPSRRRQLIRNLRRYSRSITNRRSSLLSQPKSSTMTRRPAFGKPRNDTLTKVFRRTRWKFFSRPLISCAQMSRARPSVLQSIQTSKLARTSYPFWTRWERLFEARTPYDSRPSLPRYRRSTRCCVSSMTWWKRWRMSRSTIWPNATTEWSRFTPSRWSRRRRSIRRLDKISNSLTRTWTVEWMMKLDIFVENLMRSRTSSN